MEDIHKVGFTTASDRNLDDLQIVNHKTPFIAILKSSGKHVVFLRNVATTLVSVFTLLKGESAVSTAETVRRSMLDSIDIRRMSFTACKLLLKCRHVMVKPLLQAISDTQDL